MSNIEVLKGLYDRGELKPLVKGGIVSPKVLRDIEILYHVDSQLKTGVKKTKAVCCTAVLFNIQESTVYRALSSMR